MKNNIYERAKNNGCEFEATCVDISIRTWDKLMKGATEIENFCKLALLLMNDETTKLDGEDIEVMLIAYAERNNLHIEDEAMKSFVDEINRQGLTLKHVLKAFENNIINEVPEL